MSTRIPEGEAERVEARLEGEELGFLDRVRQVTRMVPAGRVATYGQIARCAGHPRGARLVGWALHGLKESDDVPWHRVVNRRGEISLRLGAGAELQRALLADEGIRFDEAGRINLEAFGWQGPAPAG